jgi:hypothetical protein
MATGDYFYDIRLICCPNPTKLLAFPYDYPHIEHPKKGGTLRNLP